MGPTSFAESVAVLRYLGLSEDDIAFLVVLQDAFPHVTASDIIRRVIRSAEVEWLLADLRPYESVPAVLAAMYLHAR